MNHSRYELLVAPMNGTYHTGRDHIEIAQRALDLANIFGSNAADSRSPLVSIAVGDIRELYQELHSAPMQSGAETELLSACRGYADALASGEDRDAADARDRLLKAIHGATGYREMV